MPCRICSCIFFAKKTNEKAPEDVFGAMMKWLANPSFLASLPCERGSECPQQSSRKVGSAEEEMSNFFFCSGTKHTPYSDENFSGMTRLNIQSGCFISKGKRSKSLPMKMNKNTMLTLFCKGHWPFTHSISK